MNAREGLIKVYLSKSFFRPRPMPLAEGFRVPRHRNGCPVRNGLKLLYMQPSRFNEDHAGKIHLFSDSYPAPV